MLCSLLPTIGRQVGVKCVIFIFVGQQEWFYSVGLGIVAITSLSIPVSISDYSGCSHSPLTFPHPSPPIPRRYCQYHIEYPILSSFILT